MNNGSMNGSPSGQPAEAAVCIAIVGSGPRGLAVLERLAVQLAERGSGRGIEVHLIDEVDVGAGRIWRPAQPEHFIMNTVAGEVSAFSGQSDGGPARAGAGPSFYEWWRQQCPTDPGPNNYPPRALYGRYMHEVLDAVESTLSSCGATLHRVRARVVDLERAGPRRVLSLADGRRLVADRVVLTTGHARPGPRADGSADLIAHAREGASLVSGDSPADMPLEQIAPGASVGILGLGLTFYDVMAALTLGRGGRFVESDDGLQYLPSGKEPVLYAGSRSAAPVQSRGRNQKTLEHQYKPSILTAERLQALHRPGRTDFRKQVLPLLEAEVNLVYLETHLRRTGVATSVATGVADTRALRACVERLGVQSVEELWSVARDFGLGGHEPLDLHRIANPFADATFASREDFDRALLAHLRRDVSEAALGNVDSPFKAAMDVMRDVRSVIRPLVDFGGLHPQSHRRDMIEWYSPVSSLLAAGPPAFRTRQLMALIAAGQLCVVGPGLQVTHDVQEDRWHLSSPQVPGSDVVVDTLIDARIPIPDIRRDPSPLSRLLLARGLWRPFVNRGDQTNSTSFESGGVDITPSPFHPHDEAGEPDLRMHVLGIPCEHTRWFTQVGSTRPGQWTDFVADADAIACRLLTPITDAAPIASAGRSRHDHPQAQPNAA